MTISLTSLDPNTYKEQLIKYLSQQTIFKDYNFEDSNLSVILDVLARNTYLNTYYKNMIFSESLLDSAQLRSNVVSRAKELNYVPGSRSSAKATVTYEVEATGITTLELPKGTMFTGRNSLYGYNFVTNKAYVAKPAGNVFTFSNIDIYEGSYLNVSYVVDSTINQDYVITNEDVDISSVTVSVINTDNTIDSYAQTDTTFGLNSESKIFFIEGYEDNLYKIEFGKGIIGYEPVSGSTIVINFRTASGIDDANGIDTFTITDDVVTPLGGTTLNYIVTTITPAAGGAERETLDSIKMIAPRAYATPESAITNTDYKTLLQKKFANIIEDVHAFGGETMTPKQYGKVIIALKTYGADNTPQSVKDMIFGYISDKNIGSVTPVIQDPDLFHLQVTSTVEFTSSSTPKTSNDIQALVESNILSYSSTHLEKFNSDFRYSKFTSMIDNTDTSISSNDTSILLTKRIIPLTQSSTQQFNIDFSNSINQNTTSASLTSTLFTWVDSTTADNIINCLYKDDKAGLIHVYKNGSDVPFEKNVGTIDYTTGKVVITKALFADITGDYISIRVIPLNKDVVITQTQMLSIDAADIIVNVSETRN